MADDHPRRSTEAFFGRRRGKTLRGRQAEAMQRLLPDLLIDLKTPPPANLADLFPHDPSKARPAKVGSPEPIRQATKQRARAELRFHETRKRSRVILEIGFGGGEHLLAHARRLPDVGFIGVEPFVNSMAKLVSATDAAPLPNLRLYDDDATQLLDWLPEASIDQIDLLYPDPWTKTRHHKRRFVSPVNLDRFARVMKPGATFRFASDIDGYINWTLQHMERHPAFEWTARRADDWRKPYPHWPGTRYEQKALREGRTPAYLTFRRL